jgi:glycine oxidase
MFQESIQAGRIEDIIVIGGGVIGLSIARSLARRGARNVIVIEKNDFSREASWAAGGILAPQVEANAADAFFRLASASRDMYPAFAQALLAETGIDIELDTTGILYVAFSIEEEIELRRRYEWQTSEGLDVEWLAGNQARVVEPCLSQDVRCALRFPNDFQVENRKLVEALLVSNRRCEVQLIADCEVREVRVSANHVQGVETANGFIGARTVVLAAGAWSSSLDPSAHVEVEPVRGQMLCFHTDIRFARHVIYSSRGYLIPRRDGRLIAGSTTERVGFDKRVTAEGIDAIRAMAVEIAPAVSSLSLANSWAGFRPRTPDDMPVLGMSPDVEGLYYATGHYRNGILLAPITGELMADAIAGTISPLMTSFSPRRFHALSSVE